MLPSLKCVLTQLTFTFSKLTIEVVTICSKSTMKARERRYLRRYGVFIVNFELIFPLFLLFLLLTLNRQIFAGNLLIDKMCP